MNWLTVKHPVRAGVICVLVGIALVAAALFGPQLIMKSKTNDYHAIVANATGLQPADPVNVAGVPSGTVTSLAVEGNTVDVAFRLDGGVTLGQGSTAAIKILTVLGRRSLDVTPAGPGHLRPGSAIPLERTTVPFTLDDLGRGASSTSKNLDVEQLRTMIATIAQVTPKDPKLIGQALSGVTQVSATINRNAEQISQILTAAQATTQTLLDQKETLVTLLGNADLVLATLAQRRDVIGSLITDVDHLTTTAKQFLGTNQALIDSVLTKLDSVTKVLTANQTTLTTLLDHFAPSVRYVTNATGNGNFLEINSPATLIPDNALCAVGLVQGCK